jgi:hypothetical protein
MHPDELPSLQAQLPEPAAAWLAEAITTIRSEPGNWEAFLLLWSRAGRQLGIPADVPGRALLLRAALESQPAPSHPALVDDLFATGEIRERVALLRALPELPASERFAAIAIEAVRSNATSVVEAIACDNPYPKGHFPDAAFHQMVVKCLFLGLPLSRIEGLAERSSSELKRMVTDYASERRAAGRSVPADVALVLEGGKNAPV